MQVSKWLRSQALLSPCEIAELIGLLNCQLYNVSSVQSCKESMAIEVFLEAYTKYVDALRDGYVKPDKMHFSVALSKEPLEAKQVGDGRYLFRIDRPVIQLQHHTFVIVDDKCHSMALGPESISWGLQFSFPQVAMDASGHCTKPLRTTENGKAFLQLQKWMRDSTRPTSFDINGNKKTFPIRTGKMCMDWIQCHPQVKVLL